MNIERFPHRTAQRIASVLAVSALAFGLVACDKPQNPTITRSRKPSKQRRMPR